MRAVLIGLIAAVIASPAFAVKQYNTMSMTCAQVQETLKREGSAQLRYPSSRDPTLPLYDTYVGSSRYCRSSDMTRPAKVPARDTRNCKVSKCYPKSHR